MRYHRSKPPTHLEEIPDPVIPHRHQYLQSLLIKLPRYSGPNRILLTNKCKWMVPLLGSLKSQIVSRGMEDLWDDRYLYLTVRHGDIHKEHNSQWHLDGFSADKAFTKPSHISARRSSDLMLTWCDKEPTEFIEGMIHYPKDLDPTEHNVNWYLDDRITGKLEDEGFSPKEHSKITELKVVKSSVGWNMYTGDDVHRASPSLPEVSVTNRNRKSTVKRTFVRLALLTDEIKNSQCEQYPFAYKKDLRNKLQRYLI